MMYCSEILHESHSHYTAFTFGSNFFTLWQDGSAIHYFAHFFLKQINKKKNPT